MRAAIHALMFAFWFSGSPGLARNGETGILIMVQTFELVQNEQHEVITLVLCNEDVSRISELLADGFITRIFLPSYGIFEVEATPEGEIKLYQKNIDILSRECLMAPGAKC